MMRSLGGVRLLHCILAGVAGMNTVFAPLTLVKRSIHPEAANPVPQLMLFDDAAASCYSEESARGPP